MVGVSIAARLASGVITLLAAIALSAQPAAANTTVRTVFQVDDTAVDRETCGFGLHFYFVGSVTVTDYVDSGFLYKTIAKGRPGPFTVTVTAKETTLTQQNSSYSTQIIYNPDGSRKTITDNGPFNKFTVPGGGVVLLDAGHIVFDSDFNILFESGPRQATHGDFNAFCAAFG
jgi:hypothetical protein